MHGCSPCSVWIWEHGCCQLTCCCFSFLNWSQYARTVCTSTPHIKNLSTSLENKNPTPCFLRRVRLNSKLCRILTPYPTSPLTPLILLTVPLYFKTWCETKWGVHLPAPCLRPRRPPPPSRRPGSKSTRRPAAGTMSDFAAAGFPNQFLIPKAN